MKEWLDVAYMLTVALVVFFGCRKSRRFHQELQKVPEEQREEYLKRRGQLGFWEGGAVRKLPASIAMIGYFLAASALVVILVYITFCVVIYIGR